MKTKFNFKAHVLNKLLTYVFLLIVIPILSCYLVDTKTAPKKHEKFSLFVAAELKEKFTLKEELEELFPEDLLVKVESYTPNESMFNTFVDTYGATSDVLIFPKSYLEDIEYFPYKKFNVGDKYYSDSNFIKFDFHFGLLISDSNLKDYINFLDEDYYLMIGPNSVHTLNIFEEGNTDQIDRFIAHFSN